MYCSFVTHSTSFNQLIIT
eukprot:UN17399